MKDEILIHASFSQVKQFTPRIPENRLPGENDTIPRICFSTKLESALTSMPSGGIALKGLLKAIPQVAPVIHIYCCYMWENEHVRFIQPIDVERFFHVLDAVDRSEWWALDTPKLHHCIIKIQKAELKDCIDQNENKNAIVEKVFYNVIRQIPSNAPERFFDQTLFPQFKKHDLRDIFAYLGAKR
ncbi:hypothetical protein D7Y09_14100 [bacterium 1XD42-1]|nr:hypothetical protein D7X25_24685 [bacterium 1XD42-8]RKJ62292.1 hypothetical protein D7Y09_14100 [bacterium 1XD42-1]